MGRDPSILEKQGKTFPPVPFPFLLKTKPRSEEQRLNSPAGNTGLEGTSGTCQVSHWNVDSPNTQMSVKGSSGKRIKLYVSASFSSPYQLLCPTFSLVLSTSKCAQHQPQGREEEESLAGRQRIHCILSVANSKIITCLCRNQLEELMKEWNSGVRKTSFNEMDQRTPLW